MKTALRAIVCAASLLFGSSLFAAMPAPAVQVTVKNGFSTVFQGITDEAGKFSTAPLAPGLYRFELRSPKRVVPVRYFLALAGAKPVGETLTNANGDLMMDAEVRRPTSVRGQVRGLRVMVSTPVAALDSSQTPTVSTSSRQASPSRPPPATLKRTQPTNRSTPPPLAATPAPAAVSSTTSVQTTFASRPATSAAAAAPRRAVAVSPSRAPTAPPASSSDPASWPVMAPPPLSATSNQPAFANRPTGFAAPNTTTAPPLVPRPVPLQPRIINGKRYIWVAVSPGSNLGRWVTMDTPQRP